MKFYVRGFSNKTFICRGNVGICWNYDLKIEEKTNSFNSSKKVVCERLRDPLHIYPQNVRALQRLQTRSGAVPSVSSQTRLFQFTLCTSFLRCNFSSSRNECLQHFQQNGDCHQLITMNDDKPYLVLFLYTFPFISIDALLHLIMNMSICET